MVLENQTKRKVIVLLIILAILIFGFLAIYKVLNTSMLSTDQEPGVEKEFYFQLVDANSDFALAENFARDDDYDQAIFFYKKALEKKMEPDEQAQIEYKLALSYRDNEEAYRAISIFKAIVANEDYPRRTRAYAAQSLGRMVSQFNNPEIQNEIFTGNPYQDFRASDIPTSTKNLFEYSSSFYPLGIPQAKIAVWNAEKILELQRGADQSRNPEELSRAVESHKQIIRINLENADKDVQRTQGEGYKGGNYNAEILTQKAMALGLLSIAGDESLGDPEAAFKVALGASSGVYPKFYYSQFLAMKHGKTRETEIRSLLSPFYTTDRHAKTNLVTMIRNEKDNLLGRRDRILLLASIDPQFKNWLLSLGWTGL